MIEQIVKKRLETTYAKEKTTIETLPTSNTDNYIKINITNCIEEKN